VRTLTITLDMIQDLGVWMNCGTEQNAKLIRRRSNTMSRLLIHLTGARYFDMGAVTGNGAKYIYSPFHAPSEVNIGGDDLTGK
jgi:hypothetical protein